MVDTFLTRLYGGLLGLFFLVLVPVPVDGLGGGPIVPVAFHLHWVVMVSIILVGLLRALSRGVVILSSFIKYFLLFILLVLLASWFQPPINGHAFMFQMAGLVGGLLFLMAVQQFPLNEQQRRWVLWILLLAGVIQAGIGLTEIHTVAEAGISGTLFHKNILATFLATGLVIALLFMMENPWSHWKSLLFFLISSLLMTTLVLASSRMGLGGLVVGCLVLAGARWEAFGTVWKRVLMIWGLALLVVVGAIAGLQQQERVQAVASKISATPTLVMEVAKGEVPAGDKFGRLMHWEIAWTLFLEQPLWGQGIGGYSSRYRDLVRTRYPDANNTNEHAYQPYNELMRQLVESGAGAGVGMLLMVGALLVQLFRLGRQEGGTLLALMVSIALYFGVGGLLYDTAVLWFTALLLVSFPTASAVREMAIIDSVGVRTGLATVGVGLFVGTVLFLVGTARAQVEMTRYVQLLTSNRISRGALLQPALDNLYLRQMATRLFMDVTLKIAVLRQDRATLQQFLEWSKKERHLWPNYVMYANEGRALNAMGETRAAETLVTEGLRLYPLQPELTAVQKEMRQN
ncbi:MAG: O-antigen ligase family protein [Nitrospirae bacterium]|nr:O-antigen ligase family protein [Magnetococcales bacterium]